MFRERKKSRVTCEECGMAMTALLLCHHMERTHKIVLPHNLKGGRGQRRTRYIRGVLTTGFEVGGV